MAKLSDEVKQLRERVAYLEGERKRWFYYVDPTCVLEEDEEECAAFLEYLFQQEAEAHGETN